MKVYDYTKRIFQKGSLPNLLMGSTLLLLTIAVVHQASRLHQLEKRSPGANILLSRRFAPTKVLLTKTDVAAGALYIRWGRTTCPAKLSKLVYHGIVGGQHYAHTGGGSNILCLPMDPSWGKFTETKEDSQYIYGGEYQISHYTAVSPTGLFSDANSKTLHDHNIPCAVCQTLKPAAIMMLPARKTCYPGWTLEYSGYLMSSHYGHKGRNPFTCIDAAPEADPAGYRNEDGVLFYPVQAACGSLPCPPYVQGKELTCAVCSQSHRTHVHKFGFDNETKELVDID